METSTTTPSETTPSSLKEELLSIQDQFQQAAPEDIQEILYEHVKRWKATDFLTEAYKVGDTAPDFSLPDENGKLVHSEDLRKKGPMVVVFFRGNWCPYCNATLRMLRRYAPHFKARGASIVAISPQTMEQTKIAVSEGGLNFPVLSDQFNVQAQAMNIAFELEEDVRVALNGMLGGDFLAKHNGDSSYVLPVPAAYVIDSDGLIKYSFLDLDYRKRAEPVDILNALPPLKKHRRPSLSARIEVELAKLQDTVPEVKMQTLFDRIRSLKAEGVEEHALRVGSKAPDFQIAQPGGRVLNSKKLRREGAMVLIFHYGHKSPICMVQLEEMQRHLKKVNGMGANVVAIAPASSDSSSYQIAAYSGAKFSLLTDNRGPQSVAKKFGLMHTVPSQWFESTSSGSLQMDEGMHEQPMAATFVIDRSGTVIFASVDADPTQRPEPNRILEALRTSNLSRKPRVRMGPFSLLFGRRKPLLSTPRVRAL